MVAQALAGTATGTASNQAYLIRQVTTPNGKSPSPVTFITTWLSAGSSSATHLLWSVHTPITPSGTASLLVWRPATSGQGWPTAKVGV